MTKHEVILSWSDPDKSFIAEVPELPGCAADGSTRQEALANVEIVIAELDRDGKKTSGLQSRAESCGPNLPYPLSAVSVTQ